MLKTLSILVAVSALAAPMAHADAAANYKKYCVACHDKDGSGATRMGKKSGARDYRDAAVQSSFTDEEALAAIKDGVKKDGKEKMKPFAEKLSEADMKELVKYIRAFKK